MYKSPQWQSVFSNSDQTMKWHSQLISCQLCLCGKAMSISKVFPQSSGSVSRGTVVHGCDEKLIKLVKLSPLPPPPLGPFKDHFILLHKLICTEEFHYRIWNMHLFYLLNSRWAPDRLVTFKALTYTVCTQKQNKIHLIGIYGTKPSIVQGIQFSWIDSPSLPTFYLKWLVKN